MDLALPLHVGHLRASVLCSDRTGLKEQLIRGLWLIQAWRREGFGMRGQPGAAEAGMTLHQPKARCEFSWGSCPWNLRTLAVAGCRGSWEGRCGE